MQWSQWREWWYTARGKPILPDRWRLWNMWEQHNFTAYSAKFRSTPWVQTILKRMQCPPRPWSLWGADVPVSSVQGPGFYRKAAQPKNKPKITLKPAPPPFPPVVELLPRPCPLHEAPSPEALPEAGPQPKKRPNPPCPPPFPPPREAPPPETKKRKVLLPTSKAKAKTSAESSGQRDVAAQDASSSSGSAQSSGPPAVANSVPWPCAVCGQMPWKCRCHGSTKSEEVILKEYTDMCKKAGVWAKAEEQQREAEERAVEENPPAPDHPSTLWCCRQCNTMNTVHELQCSVASCGVWRPLTQPCGKKRAKGSALSVATTIGASGGVQLDRVQYQ